MKSCKICGGKFDDLAEPLVELCPNCAKQVRAKPAPAPVALKPGDRVRLLPGVCERAYIRYAAKDGDIGEVRDVPCSPKRTVVRVNDCEFYINTADLELVAPDAESAATSPSVADAVAGIANCLETLSRCDASASELTRETVKAMHNLSFFGRLSEEAKP
jgi:hypothetical protein